MYPWFTVPTFIPAIGLARDLKKTSHSGNGGPKLHSVPLKCVVYLVSIHTYIVPIISWNTVNRNGYIHCFLVILQILKESFFHIISHIFFVYFRCEN